MEIRKLALADLDRLHAMICETIDASYRDVYPPRAVTFFRRYHAKKKILARSEIGQTLVLVSRADALIVATGSLVLEERALHVGEGQYLRYWLAEKRLTV